MKKILSITVVCCMLMLTTVSGFAQTTNSPTNNIPTISVPTIDRMISMYDEMGFNVKVTNQNMNHANYELEINTEKGIIKAIVDATIDDKGNQTLKYSENGKQNIVEYKTNGDIMLDGGKVEVKTEVTAASLDEFVVLAQRYNIWQSACPYGTASDYSTDYQTVNKILTFEQAIKSYGVSALCGIIVALFVTGMPGVLLGAAVTTLITYFTTNNPTARAMSCVDKSYVHNTEGAYNNVTGEYIYKHMMTFFATLSYSIPVSTSTSYNLIKT